MAFVLTSNNFIFVSFTWVTLLLCMLCVGMFVILSCASLLVSFGGGGVWQEGISLFGVPPAFFCYLALCSVTLCPVREGRLI